MVFFPSTVVKYPAAILSMPAKQTDVENIKALQDQTSSMIALTQASGGVGLAAQQAGFVNRVLVVREPLSQQWVSCINPVVTDSSATQLYGVESCLSIPRQAVTVLRPSWIELDYIDIEGQKQSLHAPSEYARILMHEINHLDGILILNYLDARDRYQRIKEKGLY